MFGLKANEFKIEHVGRYIVEACPRDFKYLQTVS